MSWLLLIHYETYLHMYFLLVIWRKFRHRRSITALLKEVKSVEEYISCLCDHVWPGRGYFGELKSNLII